MRLKKEETFYKLKNTKNNKMKEQIECYQCTREIIAGTSYKFEDKKVTSLKIDSRKDGLKKCNYNQQLSNALYNKIIIWICCTGAVGVSGFNSSNNYNNVSNNIDSNTNNNNGTFPNATATMSHQFESIAENLNEIDNFAINKRRSMKKGQTVTHTHTFTNKLHIDNYENDIDNDNDIDDVLLLTPFTTN